MRLIHVVAACFVGILALGGLVAIGAASVRHSPAAETIEDAHGNLHVPNSYRTTYELLGAWSVAGDQGQGAKDLHVVYASPASIREYRKEGHFPDGTILVK